jgi:Fe(3+) dicitrate transport protein
MKKAPLAILVSCILSAAPTESLALEAANAESTESASIERISIIGNPQNINKAAGSVSRIDEAALENFEYDDIAQILATIPGVNIRQEDGYGLRPNIGFRGVTPERSKKINIMEDGVLIGPAPYSASAAYYFPMTSRMTAIEVTKGPATIKYGPNTVAGALNLVTRQIPTEQKGGLDIGLGTDGYGKAHGYYGTSEDNVGVLVEALHLQADGFKELDGGGDTGFVKSDIMAKINYRSESATYDQLFELKLSYSEETSDETYLGLTDEDFSQTPFRRYAGSQLDKMEWEHSQIQFTHHIEFDNFNGTTRVYRNDFERAWLKANNFTSSLGGNIPTLQAILTNPNDEENQVYYQVLSGQTDSTLRELLVLSTNDREYYSQGIQFDGEWQVSLFGLENTFEGGIRLHQDEIQRNHIEDNFNMRSGELVTTGEDTRPTTTNTEYTQALSVYLQNTVTFNSVNLTAGIRGEKIDSEYQNRVPGFEQDFQNKSTRIWLPSVSAYYGLNDHSGLFGGVHQGFVPTSPIQTVAIKVEKSVNYELGWRYAKGGLRAEFVAFYSDYSNLKESCSVSAGCDTDTEFNAGEVDIHGLEASVSDNYQLTKGLSLPWSVVYTHTQSEFKQTFYSEFNQWGFVNAGDPVPYLAQNMLSASVGVKGEQWQSSLLVNYSDTMPESAQRILRENDQDSTLTGLSTDSFIIVDISGAYSITEKSQVYARIDNLLGSENIISRRPFGARPNKPRTLSIGYKYKF